MSVVLGVISGPEADIEAQLDQVGDVMGIWFRGFYGRVHDDVDDSKRGGLLLFDKFYLNAVVFKLNGEAPVQSGVGLGI